MTNFALKRSPAGRLPHQHANTSTKLTIDDYRSLSTVQGAYSVGHAEPQETPGLIGN